MIIKYIFHNMRVCYTINSYNNNVGQKFSKERSQNKINKICKTHYIHEMYKQYGKKILLSATFLSNIMHCYCIVVVKGI